MLFAFITGCLETISIIAFYEYVDNSWVTPQIIGLVFSIFIVIYIYFVMPESPTFLHSKKRYNEARVVLKTINRFNKRLLNYKEEFREFKFWEETMEYKIGKQL